MINFAHSEVLMIGAFAVMGLSAVWPALHGYQAVLMMFLIAMILSALTSYSIERTAYRPLRHAGRLSPLISAIGVSLVLQNAIFLLVSTQSLSFPVPIDIIQIPVGFNAAVSSLQLFIFITALALMVFLHLFVERTQLGRAMRACADDLPTASLMGIPVGSIISATFIVGGILAGAAGVLYGMNYGSIKYNMGFLPGTKAFTAAVLGGIGNIRGAVLGGFVLGFIEMLAAGYIPDGAQWRDVITFMVLIVVLLIRPSGILGEKKADKL
jgi:branched-chain amino acid transport system permease protein